MKYKYFYLAVLFRILLIISVSIFGVFLYLHGQYLYLILLLVFEIVLVLSLLFYFNRVNKWITFFLLGIENEDTTLRIPTESGNKSIDEVYKALERLNSLFKQSKIDIATQEQQFRTLINQSATGLFSINKQKRVININPAAGKLTQLQEYHHINSLEKIDKQLPIFLTQKNTQGSTAIFENKYGQKLLFKLSYLNTSKETIVLVAVSDITKELDNREIDAWVKLARTLSHEIMNNITPITTLSHVLGTYFTKDNKAIEVKNIDQKVINNTIKGLAIIEDRSEGLMHFVQNYRKFTKLPEPQMHKENISKLINDNLIALPAYSKTIEVIIKKNIPDDIYVITDSSLLSQVLTNVLKNAVEALEESNTVNPQINVVLTEKHDKILISIQNSGPLISVEIREQIFVPFYSTKENGSGIGLSLSKQILLKMGGDISLVTESNMCTFEIVLEKH